MSSDESDVVLPDLPKGWILCRSKNTPGRIYFFNQASGESSWSVPKPKKVSRRARQKKEMERRGRQKEPAKMPVKRKSDHEVPAQMQKMIKEEPPEKRPKAPNKSVGRDLKPSATVNKMVKIDRPTTSSSKPGNSGKQYPTTSKIEKIEKPCTTASKIQKLENSNKPKTPALIKNLAKARLEAFQANLMSDVKREENAQNQSKKMPQRVTKKPHTETQQPKKVKVEIISPKNYSSSSSPSDSVSSSQFLAANIILSTMRAHLPDECYEKPKQKDTFAEIEQGISHQATLYPSTKHPATPPQFSEASKIVSAIKSKLAYKSKRNGAVKTYSTAKERMDAMRASMDNENDGDANVSGFDARDDEEMDVEYSKEEKPNITCKMENEDTLRDKAVLVVDTNIFIHGLDTIKKILKSRLEGYIEPPTLVVPWRVINELDNLKDNNNGKGVLDKRAKEAMDYLYKSLPENTNIKGQSLRDANSHIYPCEVPDDEILNCSLQQNERGNDVILLTNDKNLCTKAIVNGIKSIGIAELNDMLQDEPQSPSRSDLQATLKHYQDTIYQLLATILENEMRDKFDTLWQHVLFKAPPWTLSDVLQCLLKHWMAVFSEVFPRIEHVIIELRNNLASFEHKDPKSITTSEVSHFKDLCMEIAQRCQIIPEYMELAKQTVQRLPDPTNADRTHAEVVDAFEGLWTVFSSYCAKMCCSVGLPHDIEDKLQRSDPVDVLTSKLYVFSKQIEKFTIALKGTLCTETVDRGFICSVIKLESVFKESLSLISIEAASINVHNLSIFCTNYRNMLEEACKKFTRVTELLDQCKRYISTHLA